MTALKTISMYLRAAKTDAEEAGESTDGMANSVSELRSELLTLTNNKVDIMLDDKTFKSTYEIMKDLSKIWNDLADIDQANIIELIGGKRNANAITSLLANFEDAEAALQTASTATGSAYAENEKYLDSIAGKTSQLTAAFETMASSVLDSSVIKFVLDLGIGLTNTVTSLERVNLLLPSILAIATLFKTASLYNQAKLEAEQVAILSTQLVAEKTATESLVASYWALNTAQQQEVLTKLQAKVASGAITEATYKEIVAKLGLITATDAATTANEAFAFSVKSFLASNPVGWITLAISLIPSLVSWLTTMHEADEELIEDAQNLKKEYNEVLDNISNNLSTLRGLKDEFNTLAKGVDEYGNNISLTADEYERYEDIVQTILGITPEFISGYDAEGKAIASKNNLLQKSIQLLEEEQRLKKEELVSDKNLWTIAKGSIEEYKKAIDDAYNTDIPKDLMRSGVWVDNSGYRTVNAAAQLDKYISKVIGVDSKGSRSFREYVANNIELISSHIDEILWVASQEFTDEYGTKWEGLSDNALDLFRTYLEDVTGYVGDINIIKSEFTEQLQLIPQTISGYYSLGDQSKDFLTRWINTLTISKDMTETDIKQMSQNIRDFTTLISSNDDLQLTISAGIQLNTDATSDKLTVSQYRQQIQDFIDSISEFDEETQIKIKAVFGISADENMWEQEVNEKVARVQNILKDEYDDRVLQLTLQELEIAYSISAESNSLTFEELQEKIEQLQYSQAAMINPLDMDDFINGLEETASAVDKVTSAMAKLREGTALSTKELIELISEYPELLEQEDLFAEGGVEAQKNALNTILNLKEQEYDAKIDAKIAELKATQIVLDQQLDLEKQKADLINEIENEQVNGKIEQESDFIEKINELNNLQGKNYVTMKNGELQVNEKALNNELEQGAEFNDVATENIWEPYSNVVVSAHTNAYSKSTTATSTFAQRLKNIIVHYAEIYSEIVSDIMTHQWKGMSYYLSRFSGSDDIDNDYDDSVSLDGNTSNKLTVNGKSVDEWVSEQKEASNARISQLEDIRARNTNIIENLEKLKGLDLTTIYGTTGSGSSKQNKEVEEYIANIEEYYSALKRLEEIQSKVKDLEDELSHTDDTDAKIKIYSQLADAYKEEAEAERNLVNQRATTIKDNIKTLRELGFEVEYNSESNSLYIKNLEHLNELTATSVGKYDTLQEATNALRKETEELIEVTEDLNDDNIDSIDNIKDLTYEIQDVAKEIIDCIEDVYDEQIKAYNDIIEKRKEAIESAKDEYDYEEDVAEKVKEIAELQSKIDKLSLDNSREAQAQKAALIEELQEKQKELNDTQNDHAYDEQIDALDKMSEKYEEEKNAELDILRESIGTVQDLGTIIDTRVVNAWKNAKMAVEEYGRSVAGLSDNVATNIGVIPKYHSGGVVGGNKSGKAEILALLETGEIVLNDKKQEAVYKVIDFQTKLAERLGVILNNATLPFPTLDTIPNIDNLSRSIVNTTNQTVFNPEFTIEINHNGNMSDGEARRYGEKIADTAIAKLYNAFERKGIGNHNSAKLKP